MRRGWTLLTTGALVTIALSAGWSGSAGDASDDPDAVPFVGPGGATSGFAVGDSASSMSWDTTATGNRHLRMGFDFGSSQQCTFVFTAEGVTTPSRPHLMYAGHDTPGKQWRKLEAIDFTTAHHTTHAHVGTFAVTDSEPNGQWYGIMQFSALVSNDETWMFSGYNLRPSTLIPAAPQKSITIDIDCANSFTVTRIEAGTAGLSFNPPKMRGGVGASQGIIDAADLNVQDEASATFGSGHVYFRYRSQDDAGAGTLAVDHPTNPATLLLTGDDDIFTDGPAGDWAARLTRTAYGTNLATVGLIVALADVASLDAAAAL